MLKLFSLKKSIQKRLSFFTCILILCIIIIFGYASYLAIQNASVTAARNRLSALTGQISSMFSQGGTVMVQSVKETAANKAMIAFLQSNGADSADVVQQQLNNARTDTLVPLVELYNNSGQRLRSSVDVSHAINTSVFSLSTPEQRREQVGKIYLIQSRMYFPIIATVTDGKMIAGYLVKWRQLVSSKQELDGLSKLIGDQGTLYIGADDNTFWTDGLKPVPSPPVDINNLQKVITYQGPEGFPVMASAAAVPGTRWVVLVGLSKDMVTKTAREFLYIVLIIGAILLAAGIISAWFMSRYITTPLKQLTTAANGMASGDYEVSIDVNRKDELGVLANAFNRMATEVQQTQQALEKKVEERTSELQTTNEELKSFSYSVSHDLHAPLRKIKNYVQLLTTRNNHRMDEEGARFLQVIQKNTVRMEQLIDDILNLSRIGKAPLVIKETDMTALVHSVVDDSALSENDPSIIKISSLHAAVCDSSLLRQVWTNLFSNAVKYSQHATPRRIIIDSREDSHEIIYSIQDNGVGFDAGYSAKLFTAFERLHSDKEFQGTGIGLALVKRIIEKHNGKVWAKSALNQGATFYFSLPQN
ncbi:MAG: ATP-binding protein [Parafilimonas sp.]